jgi:hypothetical protein
LPSAFMGSVAVVRRSRREIAAEHENLSSIRVNSR